jgi:phosphohistidine phosphatase
MDLLIVRHAIAFERDPHRWRDDGARPLTPEGKRRANKAAAGLKRFTKPPDRLLASPLVRARQTAQILTDVAGWPRAEEVAELSPEEPPQALLTLLGKDRSELVAVVGHQPGLGYLLSACLLGESRNLPVELKKSAVACLSFRGSARAGRATLKWLATPRMLRALRSD